MDEHHQSTELMHVVNLNLPNIQISRNATFAIYCCSTDGFVTYPNAQMQSRSLKFLFQIKGKVPLNSPSTQGKKSISGGLWLRDSRHSQNIFFKFFESPE